jgi:uroporphyrinogen decarboxylase
MKGRELFLKACNKQRVDRPPVWLMRQAGRYLPEYQELRRRYSFIELAKDPSLIAEVSLQPWKRFGMDAVIVFSDILMPADAMGMGLSFKEGAGPQFEFAIKSKEEIERLKDVRVEKSLDYVYEGLRRLKDALKDDAALIGFVGGPWTVATYMMGNRSERSEYVFDLMNRINEVLCEHAAAQVKAGADVIQIFESWGSLMNPETYGAGVLPLVWHIVKSVKDAGGLAVYFAKESRQFLPLIKESGADVAGIGSDIPIEDAIEKLGNAMAVQGNLDPKILLKDPQTVKAETKKLASVASKRPGWIANLGHGVLPKTPVECVSAFVDTIKELRPI